MNALRVILLVDPDSRRRAQIGDELICENLHVEPFENFDEMEARWPVGEIVLIWDEDNTVEEFQKRMTNSGQDKLIIAYNTATDARKIVKAILGGALDYIIWPFSRGDLKFSISRAENADGIFGRARRLQARARKRIQTLTPRERQVLELVGAGLSARAIGERIGISERTVELHRYNLVKKIGGSGTWDVIRLAADSHLIQS